MSGLLVRKCIGFTGQGSQWVGMGKQLIQRHEVARTVMKEAKSTLGFDLEKVMSEGDEVHTKRQKSYIDGVEKNSKFTTRYFYIFCNDDRNIKSSMIVGLLNFRKQIDKTFSTMSLLF